MIRSAWQLAATITHSGQERKPRKSERNQPSAVRERTTRQQICSRWQLVAGLWACGDPSMGTFTGKPGHREARGARALLHKRNPRSSKGSMLRQSWCLFVAVTVRCHRTNMSAHVNIWLGPRLEPAQEPAREPARAFVCSIPRPSRAVPAVKGVNALVDTVLLS